MIKSHQQLALVGDVVVRKFHPQQLKLTLRPGYKNQEWPQEQSWLKTESSGSAYKVANISTTQADFSPNLRVGAADNRTEQDGSQKEAWRKEKIIWLRGQHSDPLLVHIL